MKENSHNHKGSLIGGIFLVAGCCIGAGMLGLPILSGLAGFLPTTVLFFLCWLFMAATGLLLLEVNLWFEENVSIISMAQRTLGPVGAFAAWGGFLFLFYALMVAYISGSGEMIAEFIQEYTGIPMTGWEGRLISSLIFGWAVYMGTKTVDWLNRFLMLGLIASYVLLVAFGIGHVKIEYLKHAEWFSIYMVIPAMIISFGYHNLIPTLRTYMKGDVSRLRLSILIGSLVPLIFYLLWEWLILGLIPVEGENNFSQALNQGDLPTQVLKATVGNSVVIEAARLFAFFALVTSFLGVALSFVDFLADGLHIKKTPWGKILLCTLVIAFPFLFALAYPKIFFTALNHAGGFGAVILFGILPAAMAWSGRYHRKIQAQRLLPGGKLALAAIFLFSCAVIAIQILQNFGALL